ncbi:autoinducer 2 ABC transporter substrate-binding protein [Jeotgalibacillus malaysiensis]|uniref:autoinducer 2 ABC transporter substrate-binding protein n=1 Tax=Jeotgalibacillus malaysiensis TaxID=1508404 RepID=UPI00384D7540
MQRQWFVILLVAMILCLVTACSRPSYQVIYQEETTVQSVNQPQNNDYTIAVIPKLEGIPYFDAAEKGAIEAAEALGVNLIYEGPSVASAEKQIEIFREMIEMDVDAIAIAANDPGRLGQVMLEAINNGIQVITWDSDTDPQYRSFFVNMVDPEWMGRHIMDLLAEQMEEKGDYAIISGSQDAANLNEWIKWFTIHQEEFYPNMSLRTFKYANEDFQTAYQKTVDILQDYRDVEGIIGISTVNPPAISEALLDYGKEGEIAVVGTSTPNLMREYLKKDIAHTMTLWSPQKLGYLTVVLAEQLIRGEMPSDGQSIPDIGRIEFKDRIVIMGQPIDFTKENVDQYDF